METSSIAEAVDLPTVTARRDLEELTVLGLAKRIKMGEGLADLWEATDTAVTGWTLLTQSDGRVRVQNPVPVLQEGTLSEKSVSVCNGEGEEEDHGLCSIGDVSDKVPNLASRTEKRTVTQPSEPDNDDEIPF